jgi:predicted ATPase
VIVIEDLHWVDKTSEEYVSYLIDGLAGLPLLMVLTYRSEYEPAWMKESFVTQIALPQLSTQESLAVVRSVAEPGDVNEAMSRSILARAEGNPLFLEELSRVAFEPRDLTDDPLPETIHDVLSARIDGLSQPAKRAVQAAAVLGREVSFRLLEAVSDQPESLDETVRELTRREFLYERPRGAERVYVFRHALVQEVAYSTLLEQQRALLHGRAARALEGFYDRPTDEVVELLAHHFGRSGDVEKAVDYAILAGETAQRRWGNAEGLAHFEAALVRLDSPPESLANSLSRIDAVLRQGEVRFAVGQHMEQRTLLEQIGPLVERFADPPASRGLTLLDGLPAQRRTRTGGSTSSAR